MANFISNKPIWRIVWRTLLILFTITIKVKSLKFWIKILIIIREILNIQSKILKPPTSIRNCITLGKIIVLMDT